MPCASLLPSFSFLTFRMIKRKSYLIGLHYIMVILRGLASPCLLGSASTRSSASPDTNASGCSRSCHCRCSAARSRCLVRLKCVGQLRALQRPGGMPPRSCVVGQAACRGRPSSGWRAVAACARLRRQRLGLGSGSPQRRRRLLLGAIRRATCTGSKAARGRARRDPCERRLDVFSHVLVGVDGMFAAAKDVSIKDAARRVP